ncbi:MlaD family protein [Bacteroides sp. 224]|uniref:MlaD family protein n=1 Tax=Bacteroides sp. 224 TaxID=2302936 RepID=UPI0013D31E5F|nr:MlaD family protein [Bacteroides sp. 224]NDV65047.1 MCE family protein [Bacteroides sp. 224]
MNLQKYFTKEVRIGIAGIVALCLLVYGINYLKGIRMFHPTSYFYVKYTNINGLTKSSPVFADGYKVGIVSDIIYDYNSPGNVIVEVDLDQDMRIPKGSSAELETEMLGGVRMNILLANNPRERHEIGDTIPGISTSGLMGTVTNLMPKVEMLLPKMDSILVSLNKILADENIPATLQSLRNMTANLEVTSTHINTLVGRDIPQLTSKLNTIGDNFVVISDNLKDFDYSATLHKVDSTISNVKMLTERLNSREGSIGMLLNDTQLYNNLNSTTANAASLLEDLQKNPKRYVHFSLFGRKNK